jgi:hypothetical protein
MIDGALGFVHQDVAQWWISMFDAGHELIVATSPRRTEHAIGFRVRSGNLPDLAVIGNMTRQQGL